MDLPLMTWYTLFESVFVVHCSLSQDFLEILSYLSKTSPTIFPIDNPFRSFSL